MNRSAHFLSELGDAVCESCGNSWPCHRSAWGAVGSWSRCAVCRDGRVFWYPPDDDATETGGDPLQERGST